MPTRFTKTRKHRGNVCGMLAYCTNHLDITNINQSPYHHPSLNFPVRVELVSTESTRVVEVWPVVNITTELTWISTIQVTSVRLV
ncbi:unnamed protein product [Ambrosiozyma monospora]|uniref:Unnamed protein product n=1 Tax=Ambrosiozyma monospora TaxID=43982 RepID=A0ACB5T420_AMBMO|nr:unnamed protein product [Ambrosiozyma monospora]